MNSDKQNDFELLNYNWRYCEDLTEMMLVIVIVLFG